MTLTIPDLLPTIHIPFPYIIKYCLKEIAILLLLLLGTLFIVYDNIKNIYVGIEYYYRYLIVFKRNEKSLNLFLSY